MYQQPGCKVWLELKTNRPTIQQNNQVYVFSSPSVHMLCVIKPIRPHTVCVFKPSCSQSVCVFKAYQMPDNQILIDVFKEYDNRLCPIRLCQCLYLLLMSLNSPASPLCISVGVELDMHDVGFAGCFMMPWIFLDSWWETAPELRPRPRRQICPILIDDLNISHILVRCWSLWR